jgi:hypothetical protein
MMNNYTCLRVMAIYITSDPPRLRMGAMLILKSFSVILYILYTCKSPLESLYVFKKSHQNPLGSFIDLSIHRDRQREVSLFYTVL